MLSLLNKENKVREIVMDFPKAFDTLNGSLMCKVKTFGFDEIILTLIQSYFSNRHEKITKKAISLILWLKI